MFKDWTNSATFITNFLTLNEYFIVFITNFVNCKLFEQNIKGIFQINMVNMMYKISISVATLGLTKFV
jgi:hypothetical protein